MFAKVSLLWGILFCELCNILLLENLQSITTWGVTESSSKRYFCFLIINCHHGSNKSNKAASAMLVIIYWTRIMYQACLTNTILWFFKSNPGKPDIMIFSLYMKKTRLHWEIKLSQIRFLDVLKIAFKFRSS